MNDAHIYIYIYIYQAGVFKTSMHLATATVYIRMVFNGIYTLVVVTKSPRTFLRGRGASLLRTFVWFLLNHMELRQAEGIRILEGSSTLLSMSQRCHGCHNIVIDRVYIYSWWLRTAMSDVMTRVQLLADHWK